MCRMACAANELTRSPHLSQRNTASTTPLRRFTRRLTVCIVTLFCRSTSAWRKQASWDAHSRAEPIAVHVEPQTSRAHYTTPEGTVRPNCFALSQQCAVLRVRHSPTNRGPTNVQFGCASPRAKPTSAWFCAAHVRVPRKSVVLSCPRTPTSTLRKRLTPVPMAIDR